MNQAYHVKLDAFEGPLDLLLHLINQYEIDIYDIPMAQITDQYMNYIHTFQHLELNIASEYLVMASTLVAIKSQMLLPTIETIDDSDEYMEDPREELMQRLIEYRKYKEAAGKLKEKEIDAHHIFTRPAVVFDDVDTSERIVEQGDISVYDMLDALGKVVERRKWNEPLDTKIKQAQITIEQKMEEVLQLVKQAKHGIVFDELFSYKSRTHIVVTFMALLELMKKNDVYCRQTQHLEAIHVFYMEE
ncbi:segregation/condensation protein A [Virgibacillus sp. NKC19-16]|uniref:segregation/condensation protein A n=1 Tax=Virgibacillus salidurans TaxID=2831673 RepID=UPI001F2B1ECB|nr:segregation/condensation protein A [Virgibacillus sp. NKC19-16]UJL44755.1 segregation/condensation protein A [Virgibacillus sp. NKC19-16]